MCRSVGVVTLSRRDSGAVEAESAEYWYAPTSKVKTAVGVLKAVVRKDPDEFPAENRTVQL